jgi:hypothetical protein
MAVNDRVEAASPPANQNGRAAADASCEEEALAQNHCVPMWKPSPDALVSSQYRTSGPPPIST